MKPRIGEFKGDPWDGIEMPEGFDPEKNPFLNSNAKGNRQVPEDVEFDIVEAIMSSDLYRKDNGLLSAREGTGDMAKLILSEANSIWGMLLHAAGYKDEAKGVVDSIMALENLYIEDDGLVMTAVKQDGSGLVNDLLHSSTNCAWGLLLYATGNKEGAERVISSIKNSVLYLKGGLVGHNSSNRDRMLVKPHSNVFWGMLLHAAGYKDEAEDVFKAMKSPDLGLYRDHDGLVKSSSGSFGNKGTLVDGGVSSAENCAWGLLLDAIGYHDEAKQVAESLYNFRNDAGLRLCRTDGLMRWKLNGNPESSVDKRVMSEANAWWGMLLRATHPEYAQADGVISSVYALDNLYRKSDNLVRHHVFDDGSASPDRKGNVAGTDVRSTPNVLWGLLRLKDGYKVFTGEK